MTDITEETREQAPSTSGDTASRSTFWWRFAGFAIAGGVVAFSAVVGFSIAYCREPVGAVFWTFLMAFGAPIETAMNEPGVFFQVLLGYLAIVAVVSRSTRVRFSWKWFAPVLAAALCVSLAATWMFADSGVCRIM